MNKEQEALAIVKQAIFEGWHKEYKDTIAEKGLKRTECLWMNYDFQQKLF